MKKWTFRSEIVLQHRRLRRYAYRLDSLLISNGLLASTERFLGGLVSSYLSRGRFPGYGIYVTDQRIVGTKRRQIPFLVTFGLAAIVIASTWLVFIMIPVAMIPALLFLFLAAIVAPAGSSMISDKWMNKPLVASKNLPERRDFELARDQIREVVVKRPSGSFDNRLGWNGGYLSIWTTTLGSMKDLRITIFGSNQYEQVSALIQFFCSLPPAVRYVEDRW